MPAQTRQRARSRNGAPRRRPGVDTSVVDPPPEPRRQAPDPFGTAVRRNRRAAALVSVVPALMVAAIVVVATLARLPIAVGGVLAAVVIVFALLVWVGSSRSVLASLRTSEADPAEHARLHNVVEGLCAVAGLPKPGLRVLGDPAPNALSVGRAPRDAVIVFTSGLLSMLDRIELEAVVAHELAHIKRHDTLSGGVAAATCGRLGAHRLAARVAGPAREPLADLGAVRLTRYPPGLVSALERVTETGSTRPEALSPSTLRATAGLWLVPVTDRSPGRRGRRDGSQPGEDGAGAVELPGELDLDERMALLREL